MLFAPVPGRADPDREAALRAGSERQGNGQAGRPGQGHRQPRAETGTVVRVQRERVIPPLPAETAEDRAVDVHAVLLRPRGAAEGRPEAPRVPQTASHGLGPAALVGHGRAAPWVEPRADRGQAEAGVPRRPRDARQPRVPPPMDPREAPARPGPQAVPAAGQEAPRQTEGAQGQGAAHPDARAHLAAAEDGGLARAVRPPGVGHDRRCGPVPRVHRHAGRAQKCISMLLYIVKGFGVLGWLVRGGDGLDPECGASFEFG